jgi:hypothetical protein
MAVDITANKPVTRHGGKMDFDTYRLLITA